MYACMYVFLTYMYVCAYQLDGTIGATFGTRFPCMHTYIHAQRHMAHILTFQADYERHQRELRRYLLCLCLRAVPYTRTYTYMHAYMHNDTHTHTYICSLFKLTVRGTSESKADICCVFAWEPSHTHSIEK